MQVALSSFLTAQPVTIHLIFMAAAVSILPLVLVFVFLQRRLVQFWKCADSDQGLTEEQD